MEEKLVALMYFQKKALRIYKKYSITINNLSQESIRLLTRMREDAQFTNRFRLGNHVYLHSFICNRCLKLNSYNLILSIQFIECSSVF